MTLTYQTKKEDLEKWFKFSIEYWLNPKKGKTGLIRQSRRKRSPKKTRMKYRKKQTKAASQLLII